MKTGKLSVFIVSQLKKVDSHAYTNSFQQKNLY